jgi:hypothetical protein
MRKHDRIESDGNPVTFFYLFEMILYYEVAIEITPILLILGDFNSIS